MLKGDFRTACQRCGRVGFNNLQDLQGPALKAVYEDLGEVCVRCLGEAEIKRLVKALEEDLTSEAGVHGIRISGENIEVKLPSGRWKTSTLEKAEALKIIRWNMTGGR